MTRTRLDLVQRDLNSTLKSADRFVVKAERMYHSRTVTKLEYEKIIAQAFLNCFAAWETFLSDSFVLYLVGKHSPGGYAPIAFSTYRTKNMAYRAIKSGGRFVPWNDPVEVINLARRFFDNGEPYNTVLSATLGFLQELIPIRNRIPHTSRESQEAFEKLIRRKLTIFPPRLTPGRFLTMTSLGSNPPISFFKHYTEPLPRIAALIVP